MLVWRNSSKTIISPTIILFSRSIPTLSSAHPTDRADPQKRALRRLRQRRRDLGPSSPRSSRCKLVDIDPQAYLVDALTKIVNGHRNSRLVDLLRGPTAPASPRATWSEDDAYGDPRIHCAPRLDAPRHGSRESLQRDRDAFADNGRLLWRDLRSDALPRLQRGAYCDSRAGPSGLPHLVFCRRSRR